MYFIFVDRYQVTLSHKFGEITKNRRQRQSYCPVIPCPFYAVFTTNPTSTVKLLIKKQKSVLLLHSLTIRSGKILLKNLSNHIQYSYSSVNNAKVNTYIYVQNKYLIYTLQISTKYIKLYYFVFL